MSIPRRQRNRRDRLSPTASSGNASAVIWRSRLLAADHQRVDRAETVLEHPLDDRLRRARHRRASRDAPGSSSPAALKAQLVAQQQLRRRDDARASDPRADPPAPAPSHAAPPRSSLGTPTGCNSPAIKQPDQALSVAPVGLDAILRRPARSCPAPRSRTRSRPRPARARARTRSARPHRPRFTGPGNARANADHLARSPRQPLHPQLPRLAHPASPPRTLRRHAHRKPAQLLACATSAPP